MFIEERVQKFEYKLNDTDDQIIDYILKNKKNVINESIQSLASNLFTVPNTIIRLSKKLGFDGYAHLKNNLKEEIYSEQYEIEDSLHSNLQRTFDLIDINKMAVVAKMIQQSKRVLIFGVGDTGLFCEMLMKNLKIAGKQSEYYIHRHDIVHGINQLTNEGVLFLVSLSGETSQVLEVAELSKAKGIRIISLTHFNRNSLQELADISLFCFAPSEMLNGYNITDKTPLMVTIRTLSEYYWKLAK
ncbi:MurR/RpiR family transcriptional regulator [Peribacillus muralis]|uniref:MurR/RpiR family transcriptional regulator n=1 Tax=Peribacillus muralis TaxID=264697 RepID=UPI0036720ABB